MMFHPLALVAAIVIVAVIIYGVLIGCLWLSSYINSQDHDQ